MTEYLFLYTTEVGHSYTHIEESSNHISNKNYKMKKNKKNSLSASPNVVTTLKDLILA